MRWLRSWPANPPAGRAHVVDDMERLVIDDYDYTPLGSIDDDVCLLEWDMAIDRQQMTLFEGYAVQTPDRVIVAPYKLYNPGDRPHNAHRTMLGMRGERWISDMEPQCDLFALGLAYLPRQLVREFLASPAPERGRDPRLPAEFDYADRRFTDQTFAMWHYRVYARRVDVIWSVRPVHLHW